MENKDKYNDYDKDKENNNNNHNNHNNHNYNDLNKQDSKVIEEYLKDSISKREEITRERMEQASKIGFKDIKEDLETTDKYGFIVDEKK
jgi:hypothetical protein